MTEFPQLEHVLPQNVHQSLPLEIQHGIENVDVIQNFTSYEEVDTFLQSYEFYDSGVEGMVLKDKSVEDSAIRISFVSVLGREYLEKYLRSLENNNQQKDIADALLYLNEAYKSNKPEDILRRIAGHNNLYYKNPSLTIPINGVYAFNNFPFAMNMKLLVGINGTEEDVIGMRQQLSHTTGDLSPHNVLRSIKNTAPPITTQIIDVIEPKK